MHMKTTSTKTDPPASTVAAVLLVAIVAWSTGCAREHGTDQPKDTVAAVEDAPGAPAGQAPAYIVKRISDMKQVVGGNSMPTDLGKEFKVMEIPVNRASLFRWKKIRNYEAKPLSASHFGLKVYMAWDDRYWYLQFRVVDDAIRSVSPASLAPYNGDCAELYFAGANTDAEQDIHDLVLGGPPEQRAFFQLQIPPESLESSDAYFADWRTDPEIKKRVLKDGFEVSVWTKDLGWNADVRIPLDAFAPAVRDKIASGEPLRAALTYLDYNDQLAFGSHKRGFHPDNVFCLDAEERNVNVPGYMRPIVFRR